MNWDEYNKDIRMFDDVVIRNNDIDLIENPVELMISIVNERITTSNYDFMYDIYSGSNLDSFKGTGISESLVSSIKFNITNALTKDGFINKDNLSIKGLVHKNTINLYITIKVGNEQIETKVKYFNDGSIRVD